MYYRRPKQSLGLLKAYFYKIPKFLTLPMHTLHSAIKKSPILPYHGVLYDAFVFDQT